MVAKIRISEKKTKFYLGINKKKEPDTLPLACQAPSVAHPSFYGFEGSTYSATGV